MFKGWCSRHKHTVADNEEARIWVASFCFFNRKKENLKSEDSLVRHCNMRNNVPVHVARLVALRTRQIVQVHILEFQNCQQKEDRLNVHRSSLVKTQGRHRDSEKCSFLERQLLSCADTAYCCGNTPLASWQRPQGDDPRFCSGGCHVSFHLWILEFKPVRGPPPLNFFQIMQILWQFLGICHSKILRPKVLHPCLFVFGGGGGATVIRR